jgi:hypothetical protein
MRSQPMRFIGFLLSCVVVAACGGGQLPVASVAPAPPTSADRNGLARAVCPQVVGGATCSAVVESRNGIGPAVAGWAPSDIQTVYNLPSSTKGSGQIIAIVDAYDDPNVASDLAVYRSEFGLGTANFTKYNQKGQMSNYPTGNESWGVGKSQEVDMISAACPLCTIYLVEAKTNSGPNLGKAEVEAVKLGAHIVVQSWWCEGRLKCGGIHKSEFDTPGVVYVDTGSGYNENGVPEAYASVVAVGGTVLSKAGSTYSETVWHYAIGGCSNNGSGPGITKPKWQHDPDCTYRTDTDISAVDIGVAYYDSYGYGGWLVGGGSSSPAIIAGVYGLAGNAGSQKAPENFWTMSAKKRNAELHYISTGSDGSCGGEYLCEAGTNQFGTYSGPAGWGTPNGIGAF